jgi:hypothetical protein
MALPKEIAALVGDVANTIGYAEACKEFMHEDVLKIGNANRANSPSLSRLVLLIA